MRGPTLICLLALASSCSQHRDADLAPLREVRQAEADLGFEATRNFHREGARDAYHLCYATGRLELPDDYDGLRSDLSREASCRFDPEKLDVFVYPAEALAGRAAPVTESLASAGPRRRDFVVAHEDFHEQPGVRQLKPPLKEAVSMLAGFLATAEAARLRGDHAGADQALRETDLFLQKANRVNAAHKRLKEAYAAYRRREIDESQALMQKKVVFAELEQSCGPDAERPHTFHPCPAALNNAGLAFDVTYTREYPRVHAMFEETGRDPALAIGALKALARPTVEP